MLKREDLNHTGSHKINNVLGQALLTRRMGKTRVIAETGAGQHGVATATAAALFGLDCTVYMGKVDTERQALNVARMRLLGAEVIAVESGTQTLKDAMNEAMRDWVASVDHTHYLIGTVAGPHPFPMLVREFQRVISTEARASCWTATAGCPTRWRPASAAAPTRWASSRTSSTTPRSGCTASRPAATAWRPAGMRRRSPPDRSGCCTGCAPSSCRTRTARPRTRTRSRPAWTIPVSAPSTPGWRRPAGALRAGHRCGGDGGVPAAGPHRGHRAGHRVRPRAGRGAHPGPPTAGPADGQPPLILVSLSGRGDKDVDTAIKWFDLDTRHRFRRLGSRSTRPAPSRRSTWNWPARRPGPARSCEQRARAHGSAVRRGPGQRSRGPGGLPARRLPGRTDLAGRLPRPHRRRDSPGVDLVEVGMPYSDPMMDGVTIQRAGTKALARGVRTRDAFAAVEAVAGHRTPAVVMTYWNLIEQYGPARFARDLAAAGGAGAITPDLTPDEAGEWLEVSDAADLDRIFLVSPSSTDERLAHTVAACRGWVYATSVMGVTGARAESSSAAPALVARIRAVDPEALVGVGLGVSNGTQAREVAGYADAVIVGSALVRTLLDAEDAGRPGRPQRPACRGDGSGRRRTGCGAGTNLADVRLGARERARTAAGRTGTTSVGGEDVSRTAMRVVLLAVGLLLAGRRLYPADRAPGRPRQRRPRGLPRRHLVAAALRDARRHPHRHRRASLQPDHLAVAAGHPDVLRLHQVPRRLRHGAVRGRPGAAAAGAGGARRHPDDLCHHRPGPGQAGRDPRVPRPASTRPSSA